MKKESKEVINSYTAANNNVHSIQEKEWMLDWKQGGYYVKVIFNE